VKTPAMTAPPVVNVPQETKKVVTENFVHIENSRHIE